MSSLKSWVLAIVGICGLPFSTFAETVTFTHEVPKVGTRIKKSSQMSMKLDISVATAGAVIQEVTTEESKVSEADVTILGVNEVAPNKVKISYGNVEESSSSGGEAKPKLALISNKTYIAATTGSEKLDIIRADGSTPPSGELELVRSDFSTLGQPDEFAKMFHGRALPEGSAIPIPDDLLAGALGEEFGSIDCELTLSGMREGLAVISMTMTAVVGMAEADMTGKVDLTGEMLVLPEGSRVISMRLEGPIQLEGRLNESGMELDLKATGTMTLEDHASYSSGED